MDWNDLLNFAAGISHLSGAGLLALFAVLAPAAFIREWIVSGRSSRRKDVQIATLQSALANALENNKSLLGVLETARRGR